MNYSEGEVLNTGIVDLQDKLSKEAEDMEHYVKIVSMLIIGFEYVEEDNADYVVACLSIIKKFFMESGKNITMIMQKLDGVINPINQESTGDK